MTGSRLTAPCSGARSQRMLGSIPRAGKAHGEPSGDPAPGGKGGRAAERPRLSCRAGTAVGSGHPEPQPDGRPGVPPGVLPVSPVPARAGSSARCPRVERTPRGGTRRSRRLVASRGGTGTPTRHGRHPGIGTGSLSHPPPGSGHVHPHRRCITCH